MQNRKSVWRIFPCLETLGGEKYKMGLFGKFFNKDDKEQITQIQTTVDMIGITYKMYALHWDA